MSTSERVPPAYVVVDPGGSAERVIPVYDSLFVGRECAGVDDSRRFVVDDPEVSRNHLELRLDAGQDRAYVVDTSTNGTRVNGMRIERNIPVIIRSRDRIVVGAVQLEFQSEAFQSVQQMDPRRTAMRISQSTMMMVVGDIIGYSTISQYTDGEILTSDLHALYGPLKGLLVQQRGTLSDYAGDAVFAVWDYDHMPDAPTLAVDFALRAVDLVAEVAPSLRLRDPEGQPLRMGWAVVEGRAAISSLTGSLISVVGDAANLAFRLSGVAGRKSRAPVIVTKGVHDLIADRYRFGAPSLEDTKGRTGQETVYEVSGPVQTLGSETG